jgi:recombination associated protein RdgC
MSRREQARADAAFQRGAAGVDGLPTEEERRDEAEVEKDKAREQLLRGRTYLGRELLTWLLWRSESTEPVIELDGAGVTVVFVGRLTLRGIAGDVTELVARGALAPYSAQVRRALDAGLLVHQARVRLEHAERVYEATLDAEFLDVRAAKLPELLTEEEDDRLLERLELAERLSAIVDALTGAFLDVRTSRTWRKRVATLKTWMRERDEA